MFVSFLILIIAGILTLSVSELAKTYEFLLAWVLYTKWALVIAVILFLTFTVISVIKAIKKWLL